MALQMKAGPKIFMIAVIFAALFFGVRYYVNNHQGTASVVPQAVTLANAPETTKANVAALPMPGTSPVHKGQKVRMMIWKWNAQQPLLLANGGTDTTEGSLMAKNGIDLHFTNEDDTSKMAAQLTAMAKDMVDRKANDSDQGQHFVVLMGDGTPSWFQGLNPLLAKICSDCTAEWFGISGRSAGEDKLMGPQEWKTNPKAAKGALIAGVIGDGDWNTAMKWAADNNIKNNPDEKTYDPDALNWVKVDTYLQAAEKYILGDSTCEDRPVVSNGVRTGTSQHVCINGVVTWTPGDVNVAQKRGGLVSIVSTREYRSQMPAAIIGIKKWDAAHPDVILGLLRAVSDAADQIKAYPAALTAASEISAKVYNEENGSYWEKYFKGSTETDKQGLSVQLGGSAVCNLADSMQWFGLASGSANLAKATYEAFGDIAKQQKVIPAYPSADSVINTSYVQKLASTAAPATTADMPNYATAAAGTKTQVSKKAWSINFETGSASFTPDATSTLNILARDLEITDLLVEIDGNTDNTGNSESNKQLSLSRANAVKSWLKTKSPSNFPEERFEVHGYGQDKPVASNQTEGGRSKNRRVDIVLAAEGTN